MKAAAIVLLLALPAASRAQQTPVADAGEAGAGDVESSSATLTGDWGGLRSAWEERGIVFEGSWIVDTAKVTRGGQRRRSTTQGLLDVNVAADLDALWGWPGASAAAEVWTKHGRVLNDDVADWQGTSNIDTPHQTQNAALWFEQWLLPERLRVKVGKVDAYDEFAVVNGAVEFLNNGMAYSPALEPVPTYPDPAWSVNIVGYPTENTWLGLGAYDGATQAGIPTGSHGVGTFLGEPSDLFLIAEAGTRWSTSAALLPGNLGLGGWRHTGEFDRFSGGDQDGASGQYVVLDQALWRESPGAGDTQGIDFFAQAARADAQVSSVHRHVSAGLTWAGLLPDRDDEVLGLGASWAQFTDEPGAGFTRDAELALEVFYKLQITPWMSVKPDVQYVTHPGGDSTLDNALVVTLRFEFTM